MLSMNVLPYFGSLATYTGLSGSTPHRLQSQFLFVLWVFISSDQMCLTKVTKPHRYVLTVCHQRELVLAFCIPLEFCRQFVAQLYLDTEIPLDKKENFKYLTIILRNRAEYRLILSRRGRRPSWLKSGDIPHD